MRLLRNAESRRSSVKFNVAILLVVGGVSGFFPELGLAQEQLEKPYFVTYNDHLEDRDTLEISPNAVLGVAQGINTFWGLWTEFEYGATKWWTTELYIEGQHTRHEGSLFTGFRFENRFRVLSGDHRVNPVLYVEYEHLNGADKILKEVVGFDGKQDFRVPNSVAREEDEHEFETKLILSSQVKGWNFSENFIGAKNIHGEPWEFGYAAGLSRPLKFPTGKRCAFCLESVTAGLEMYGGLGTWNDFTLRGTSQYIAPVVKWDLPSETAIRISPGWGLTDTSVRMLFRIGVSQEIDEFGHKIAKLFGGH
jgi:hypothetical protein